jgi:2-methylcitrate dehydratase PrpD
VDYEQRAYAAAPDAFPGGVRVRTRDGRVLEAELRHQRGGADNPMRVDEVLDKFRVNARQALPGTAVAELESATLDLESQPTLAVFAILGEAREGPDAHEGAGRPPVRASAGGEL